MSSENNKGFIRGVFATLAAIAAMIAIYEFVVKGLASPQSTIQPPATSTRAIPTAVFSTSTPVPTTIAQMSPTPTQASQLPPSFYLEKGTTSIQNGQYRDAIANFTTCVQLYPSFADCYNGLGMAYREIDDFQQSLPNHDKAIALNPRYDFYFERGVTYHQLRSEYDKAIQDFKTCIEKNASFCNCYVRLGMAYRDEGNFTTAMPYHDKAIELCPTRGDFYWERGVTYQRMGNTSQADDDFKKARELGYDR